MNINQLVWASEHDWCKSVDFSRGEARVYEVIVHNDFAITENILTFNNYQELRLWAGY